jgi:curved DNA-binding protein CbpA
MDSTPEQRLGLTLDASDNELTAKKRTLARAYHPDRHQLDAPTLNILNARVGEITKAYAEIKKNRQRGR